MNWPAPISTKERMPMRYELPVLVWLKGDNFWVSYGVPLDPNFVQWWLPMPPAPGAVVNQDA